MMKPSLFAAVSALLTCAVAAPASAATMDLTLVERATSDVVSDHGATGDSVGDILTFNNEVYDESNKTPLGRDSGFCIRTIAGKAWECTWTVTLADGLITVQGTFLDGQDSVLVVTGGTGAFATASGEMTLHARNPEETEHDFIFRLER